MPSFIVKIKLTYIILLACFSALGQDKSFVNVPGKTRIEILGADELVYKQAIGRYQMCKGNVRFKQGAMFMDCDSARFYEDINKIEAFGNIYIRQKDTLNLWGDAVEYDGDTRQAKIMENVKLSDGKMVLTTDQLNYDLVDKIGSYNTGANIVNGQDKMYSDLGTYYSRTKDFFFKDNVKLTNPEYTMDSDTLRYNTKSKLASFYGPTFIKSEENTIYCQYGWYNTAKEVSQFSKGAYIQGKDNKLVADSMMYYRNTGLGEAFGNLHFEDTSEQIIIKGQYGKYERFTKTTLITGEPMAIKNIDGDSFYLRADTFLDLADTSNSQKRMLKAYHDVIAFKSDIQAIADSLVYNFTDSTIGFFKNPVIWTDSNQVTGDTIMVYRNQFGLDRFEAYANAFTIEKDINGLFNQVKGRRLNGFFTKGRLYKVDVDGNGQSIYYALEEGQKYYGVNEVVCGKMVVNIDTAKRIRSITQKNKPKATFYPLEKFPTDKSRLPGFDWKGIFRPAKSLFY